MLNFIGGESNAKALSFCNFSVPNRMVSVESSYLIKKRPPGKAALIFKNLKMNSLF